jgi:CrcB protein
VITRLAMVALGGALGAVGRYGISGWVARATGQSPFPYGTLAVNVAGAFLLGALMGATASGTFLLAPRLRALLGIGFLGALTTFSTLTYETVEALRVGDLAVAAANVAVSLIVGLGACWLGLTFGQRL